MAAINDIYELTLYHREPTYETGVINVFHFRAKAVTCSASVLVTEWQTNMANEWRTLFSSAIRWQRITATSLIPYGTDYGEAIFDLAGLGGTGSLPISAAAIITWRTGQPGKRKRGRTYIGGIDRNEQSLGKMLPTWFSGKLNIFANKILLRYGAAGSNPEWEIGVWSRMNGGQNPPHSLAGFQAITSYTGQPNMGTMGTRRVGRGY